MNDILPETIYYKKKEKKASSNVPGLNALTSAQGTGYELIPNNSTNGIDIVNQHRWCNPGNNTSEVPHIDVTEYRLLYGAWAQNIAKVGGVLKSIWQDKAIDPFLVMYASETTNFRYSFPWLLKDGDNIRSVKNSWEKIPSIGDLFGGESSVGAVVGAGIAGIAGLYSPGLGMEPTYQYDETARQDLTIKFPLYNTYSIEDTMKNYAFVSLFTFQNLKTRTSFATFLPPCIYSLNSNALGGINWPLAYVSDLTIDSIGTTRALQGLNGTFSNLLVPEAYKVSITFKELIPQSSNSFGATMGGPKVVVTGFPLDQTQPGDSITGYQQPANPLNTTPNPTQPQLYKIQQVPAPLK
jgi:hypothetical protein